MCANLTSEMQKPPEGGFAPSHRSNWGDMGSAIPQQRQKNKPKQTNHRIAVTFEFYVLKMVGARAQEFLTCQRLLGCSLHNSANDPKATGLLGGATSFISSQYMSFVRVVSLTPASFHRHRFGQIARLIDIFAHDNGNMIGQQLHWYRISNGGEGRGHRWHFDHGLQCHS